MTFCHREVVHAQWKILLDDDFIEAWKHGIIVTCCDRVVRRFYPRIFTHSGDYPEKYVLLSLPWFHSHGRHQSPPGQHPESRHMPLPALPHSHISRT
jgi:hypothetical protein